MYRFTFLTFVSIFWKGVSLVVGGSEYDVGQHILLKLSA